MVNKALFQKVLKLVLATAVLMSVSAFVNPVESSKATEYSPGVITGTVVDDKNNPVAGRVFAYEVSGTMFIASKTFGQGHFSISGLVPGEYRIEIRPNGANAAAWWPNSATLEDAESVFVSAADNFTAQLSQVVVSPGSTFSGSLTDRLGNPVSGTVSAHYAWDQNGDPLIYEPFESSVGPEGKYTIQGLAATSYKLRFTPNDAQLPAQWLGGWADFASSPLQNLGISEIKAVDFTLVNTLASTPLSPLSKSPFTPSQTNVIISTNRVGGADRFDTAALVSKEFQQGVPVVYLATGLNFPDALSAASAAATQGGPVLLVTKDALPLSTSSQLTQLQPAEIVVVGGENVISESVLSELAQYSSAVRRDAGNDRYETSRIIAEQAFPSGSEHAFLATGLNFPDALAASGAAGKLNNPVILVPGTISNLDEATIQTLQRLGVTRVSIAGSSAAMSVGIEQDLNNLLGEENVLRYGGSDRYETATLINNAEFSLTERAFIATGLNFPDALAGAALAGSLGVPVYIAPTHCIFTPTLESMRSVGVTQLTILGGYPALGRSIESLYECKDRVHVSATIPGWNDRPPSPMPLFEEPTPTVTTLSMPSSIQESTEWVYDIGYTGGRPDKPNHIVLHHTAGTSLAAAISALRGDRIVSASYVVHNQYLVGMVDEADTPYTNGRWASNQYSVTFEMVNSSYSGGVWQTPSEQTKETTAWAMARAAIRWDMELPLQYGINVFGHRDVSFFPTTCPGELDMQSVINRANQILSIYPEP